jgi:uncharacterized protein YndB with AHSA1/START domain
MWSATASITTTASPQAVWRLFEDVAGWPTWNAGIERIELFGRFATGSTFSMQPPGMEAFTSTLIDVRANVGFTDETVIDGTRFVVSHELAPLPEGGTRITYATQVTGPAAGELGPVVTADFPDVLAALKARAECP